MTKPSLRIQEGALSARKTPTQPPAPTILVPIAQASRPATPAIPAENDGKSHE